MSRGHRGFSEIRRPKTPERRARIDAIACSLYHVKRVGLRPGDVEPVRFGQKLAAGSGLESRERVLEAVRAERFPGLPSRYDCTFAFTDLERAVAWLEPRHAVYEVELAGPARTYRADARWLDGKADPHHDEAYWLWAGAGYWAGLPCPWGSDWELIIEGPLVVTAVLRELPA